MDTKGNVTMIEPEEITGTIVATNTAYFPLTRTSTVRAGH
jgi:hypothetical protein